MSDRVKIGGEFTPDHFATYESEATLVFCDIEGMEEEQLDPNVAPALRSLDIIVESHECLRPGITQRLISRFESSHVVEVVEDDGWRHLENLPHWFNQPSHLDQLLATWEWRSGHSVAGNARDALTHSKR